MYVVILITQCSRNCLTSILHVSASGVIVSKELIIFETELMKLSVLATTDLVLTNGASLLSETLDKNSISNFQKVINEHLFRLVYPADTKQKNMMKAGISLGIFLVTQSLIFSSS